MVMWAGDDLAMHSTTGFVFLFAGGPITWKTKRQASVASSTTEAEYVAAALASRDALWLLQPLQELHLPFPISTMPLPIYADNQSAISLAEAPRLSSKTKHISISYHLLKELVAEGYIKLHYVPTAQNWADMLTKVVPRNKLLECCHGLGLLPPNSSG